eukprot:TRINITY_DN7388_c0_g1_i1.p1 TRINITY_DN7388_c0_g1~~TRINITY_DN7388_c0_g1_i1.p1  ORF type:complete len:262 (-),score=-6.09 TRINITY_DN7388_c0_g1_i1:1840-2625(-)
MSLSKYDSTPFQTKYKQAQIKSIKTKVNNVSTQPTNLKNTQQKTNIIYYLSQNKYITKPHKKQNVITNILKYSKNHTKQSICLQNRQVSKNKAKPPLDPHPPYTHIQLTRLEPDLLHCIQQLVRLQKQCDLQILRSLHQIMCTSFQKNFAQSFFISFQIIQSSFFKEKIHSSKGTELLWPTLIMQSKIWALEMMWPAPIAVSSVARIKTIKKRPSQNNIAKYEQYSSRINVYFSCVAYKTIAAFSWKKPKKKNCNKFVTDQ